MMTHIFANKAEKRFIAAKGAAEAIMNVSVLTEAEKQATREALARSGLRLS